MKITSLEPLIVDVESRNWLFVVVETDEGVSGVGEGSLPGHPRAVAAAVEEYREYVVGEGPARIQHLWQLMYRQPFFRSGAVTLSAMSAIEQALWDIKGKVAGLPVYQLLGGRCRDGVTVYGHANAATTDEVLAEVARYVDRGYRAVRVQTGVPGLATTYGVSAGEHYEPADAAIPSEAVWSTERHLAHVPSV